MEYVLQATGVSKSYGSRSAVQNLSMHVRKGEIYGFVGPNGAGKSTLLKMVMQLTKPDNGEIRLFGESISQGTTKPLKRIGSIIENPYFYQRISGRGNLELHCAYMGYHNLEEIDRVLDLVSLAEAGGKPVAQYSLGMKQRLAIARAILTKPEFLILDEPINALDPEGIQQMRTLFRSLNRELGTTILVSSHILSEVELIADRIGIIKQGHLLKEIAMSDIHELNTNYRELEVTDTQKAGMVLGEYLGIHDIQIREDNTIRVFDLGKTGVELTRVLTEHGVGVESIVKKESTLEEYFFRATKEDLESA